MLPAHPSQILVENPRCSLLARTCRISRRGRWLAWAGLVLCLHFFSGSQVQAAALNYTPIFIPVRDGNTLAADVYSYEATPVSKPVIFIQTPYNKNLYHLNQTFPQDSHYNYVIMDWRGFYGSSGVPVPAGFNRGQDGYDAVEWIAVQPWSNGKIGTWGTSALGLIQYQTAAQHPPHLVCCLPQVHDFLTQYENYYYGGDYRKEATETLATLGFISTATVLNHPDSDAFWNLARNSTDIANQIQVPFFVAGGWLDHFPNDVLRSFSDLQTKSLATVQPQHKLIVGPWLHEAVGQTQQGVLNYPGADNLSSLTIQFWDFYLRNQANGWDSQPAVTYYQMGENLWKSADTWFTLPGRASRVFYLQTGNRLSETPPAGAASPASYAYDPSHPTPALGGSRFSLDPAVLTGPQDLGPAIETRSDVLVFSTDPLAQSLAINGSVSVQLYVSSNRTDTDFCARLCDVYPDGRSLIMTQGIQRMRFRNSYSTEMLMTPGQIYPVTVDLQDLALTIRQGHRLRLDICSADYPHFDSNLNDGGPMYGGGTGVIAQNSVYLDSSYPSQLVLQTVNASDTTPTPSPTSSPSPEPVLDGSWKKILVFPNPAQNLMNFYIANPVSGAIKITVYNLAGERAAVLEQIGTQVGGKTRVTLDCANLAAGLYIAEVMNNGSTDKIKIAVLH